LVAVGKTVVRADETADDVVQTAVVDDETVVAAVAEVKATDVAAIDICCVQLG
jgi:hypothetical protein